MEILCETLILITWIVKSEKKSQIAVSEMFIQKTKSQSKSIFKNK